MDLPVYNGTIFFKLLYWSESYANFKQKSVPVMWRKYHVMMVYFLSQLQRWMVMIRSTLLWSVARESGTIINDILFVQSQEVHVLAVYANST